MRINKLSPIVWNVTYVATTDPDRQVRYLNGRATVVNLPQERLVWQQHPLNAAAYRRVQDAAAREGLAAHTLVVSIVRGGIA